MEEIKSMGKAIKEHCKECVGSYAELKNCGGEGTCKLFPFRFGKNPYRKKVVISEERKAEMVENLQKARDAKND